MYSTTLAVLSLFLVPALGDPIDWVSPDYVVQKGKPSGRPVAGAADISKSKDTIIRNAGNTAKEGPWCVVNTAGIRPPSGDVRDYLSWAPYHWPNCNWCPSGRSHLAHTVDGSGNTTSTPTGDFESSTIEPAPTKTYDPGDDPYQYFVSIPESADFDLHRRQAPTLTLPGDIPTSPSLPTHPPENTTAEAQSTTTDTGTIDSRTHVPQAAAKTTTKSACTPSPVKSLAPSATWTTCPYVVKDGEVNPDVRKLPGPDSLNSMSQSTIYNAFAFALTNDRSYSANVAKFLKVFFVDAATKMNPNMNFGQVVRGPGPEGKQGTFTGILDNRGLVKVANAIAIMRISKAKDWTSSLDSALIAWTKQYSAWLQTSDIGKKTASRPNNHATFFQSQLAAAKQIQIDYQGVANDLKTFFSTAFLDQIAATGEQPFEAVRTRPFHYRLFNLEALMTLGKQGDAAGINCWVMKSKYGATIQTAFDYAMKLDPKSEDRSQIFPLIPPIIAAYGDPSGKYTAYLKKYDPNYQSRTSWFGNQPAALSHAPTSQRKNTRSAEWRREDSPGSSTQDTDPAGAGPSVPFTCPMVFQGTDAVELDNGVYVTCDQLKPFYSLKPSADVEPPASV